MYTTITAEKAKIELVERLLKEGHISYEQSLKLLEVQVIKEYINYPIYNPPYWWQATPIVSYDTVSCPVITTTN